MAWFHAVVGGAGMRYIMMVLRGNMRRNKGVHISVFVLMLIISLAFCSVLSYYTNSIRHDSEAMEEVGYGGMLAALYGENRLDAYGTSADKIIKNIGKCDAVQEVKATDVVYLLLKDCNGKGGNSSFVLNDTDSVLTYDQYDVDNKMTDRRLEKGEVSVPFSFIGMYDCKIGDTVELGNDNGSYTFKVASFFEDPYMGSSVMGIKTILISDEDFADLKAKAAEDNRSGLEDDKRSFELSKLIIIDKKPGLDLTEMEFERELNNVSDFASYCWITLSKEQAGNYMLLMTKVFSAVLLIFVVLLLVAAMIVLGHNIGSSIDMDFVNIGILKAVGMTNASVKLALLAGYMCTVAAGLFAGIPLAIPILKIINSATRSSSGLEVPSDINVGLVLCVILAILLLVAAFIMLKTRRISEATPIKAIRGGRDSVHFSSVLKLPVSGKKLGVSLAYRQFISEKKQYAAAIIVTAILAMFMILMNDMMRWFNSQNMLQVDMLSVTKYDLTASFVDEDTQKDIENVISEHTAYRKYQMSSEYLLFDDVQMYCYIVEDPDMINTIRKGRTCTYDNEVLITQYVADGFHMNVGDTVTVKRGGVARKMVISGIYDSANDMGKNFAISKAAYSKFASEETVSESGVSGAAKSSSDEEEWSGKGICYDLDNTDECDAIIQEIDKRYGDNQGITYSIHSAKDDFEEVAGTVNIAIQGLTLLTYMLGAVFVIVTVIIVCGKVLMREQKDIGIYKALGFTSFRLRCQLAVRFIVTAVVGSLLGIVLALIVSKPFFKAGFESFGIYSFNLSTSVISLVIPLVFMSVLFSVVAFIRAGNIRKVQPQVLIADQ